MISANLQQWIRHPEVLNKDTLYELRTLLARYPYFQSLRLLYLKNLYLLHDITFGSELRKAILYVADRRSLFYLIEGDKYVLSRKKKRVADELPEAEPNLDRTLALIDAFLSTVPEEVTSQMNLDYTMDYTAYLLQDDDATDNEPSEAPKLRGFELIDGFIEKSENEPTLKLKPLPEEAYTVEGISEEQPSDELQLEEDEDDSCFTETLAKIYVKQQRYSKALEIIKKLSLKYPKKNAYFADQIRFLEKLIINAKSK
ncbi:tetratricopeptide repeat protein [Bacteroides sp.]